MKASSLIKEIQVKFTSILSKKFKKIYKNGWVGREGNAFNFTVPWSASCHMVGSGHSIQDPAAPTPCQSLVHSKHDHFTYVRITNKCTSLLHI